MEQPGGRVVRKHYSSMTDGNLNVILPEVGLHYGLLSVSVGLDLISLKDPQLTFLLINHTSTTKAYRSHLRRYEVGQDLNKVKLVGWLRVDREEVRGWHIRIKIVTEKIDGSG